MKTEQKQATHVRILESCASLMLQKGVKSASVAKVMEKAGLTVGGFYAHFPSKEDLVAEGFRKALEESHAVTLALLPPDLSGKQKLLAFLKGYLSPQHRDKDLSGQGCPFAALTAEMGKGSVKLRKAFGAELNRVVAERAELFSNADFKMDRSRYLAILSTCIGALTLARATRGSALSEEILATTLKSLIGSWEAEPLGKA